MNECGEAERAFGIEGVVLVAGCISDNNNSSMMLMVTFRGDTWASLGAQSVKNPPAKQDTQLQSLGRKDPLEKETATHSSILAWKITRREEPGSL